ncbi:hypothetical protein [Halomonas alkalisoli]|nr:hypothetical protein [Halomonas alkalisoli]
MAREFDAVLRGFDDLRPGQGVELDTEDRVVARLPKKSNWMIDHN